MLFRLVYEVGPRNCVLYEEPDHLREGVILLGGGRMGQYSDVSIQKWLNRCRLACMWTAVGLGKRGDGVPIAPRQGNVWGLFVPFKTLGV